MVMLRRLLKTMADDVAADREPLGVRLVDGPPCRVDAGVFTLSAASSGCAHGRCLRGTRP